MDRNSSNAAVRDTIKPRGSFAERFTKAVESNAGRAKRSRDGAAYVHALKADAVSIVLVYQTDLLQLGFDLAGKAGVNPFDLPPVIFVDFDDVSPELARAFGSQRSS